MPLEYWIIRTLRYLESAPQEDDLTRLVSMKTALFVAISTSFRVELLSTKRIPATDFSGSQYTRPQAIEHRGISRYSAAALYSFGGAAFLRLVMRNSDISRALYISGITKSVPECHFSATCETKITTSDLHVTVRESQYECDGNVAAVIHEVEVVKKV